jgi:hypothetical protein
MFDEAIAGVGRVALTLGFSSSLAACNISPRCSFEPSGIGRQPLQAIVATTGLARHRLTERAPPNSDRA